MFTKILTYNLKADEVKDITSDVIAVINESKIKNGLCNVFVKGSTAALILSEYERGHINDLFKTLESLAPSKAHYEHNKAWDDDNGKSHVRAAFLQQHITMPLINGSLDIGTWQNILLINLDIRERKREVRITIID